MKSRINTEAGRSFALAARQKGLLQVSIDAAGEIRLLFHPASS
jgi:hypothetical protein